MTNLFESILGLLQVGLILLKAIGLLTWSWLMVFMPLWFLLTFIVIFYIFGFVALSIASIRGIV